MAYKFQLGSAKLGGSIEAGAISGSALSSSAVEVDTADKVIAAVGDGDIPIAKLAESSVSFGGISLDLGGVDATPAFDLSDATDYPTSALVGTITNSQLSGAIANAKLVNDSVDFGGVSLSLGGVDATPAFNLSDATDYPTSALVGTITNTQLSGAIANAKLVNSSVSFGGVSLSLGGTDATPAFDLSDASTYPGDSFLVRAGILNSGSIASGFGAINNGSSAITTTGTGSFGKVVVSGDLSVAGALTYIDTNNLRVSDAKVVFADGASALAAGQGFYIGSDAGDASEKASFAVGDGAGTNDAFVSTLALSATNLITNGSVITDEWEISDTHISGNLPVSASAYYGDGSNLTGVSATGVQLTHGVLDSGVSATGSAGTRFTVADSNSAAMLVNLPSIAPSDKGSMYIIKRLGSNNVTISSANSSQKIEGSDQDITLETNGAAVTLLAHDDGDATHGAWLIV